MRNSIVPTPWIVVGIIAIIAVGFALRSLLSGPSASQTARRFDLPANTAERANTEESRLAGIKARDSQLRSAPSIAHSEISRFPVLVEPFIHPPPDEPSRLTPEARAALVKTLMRYASAWLAVTPDEYMTIVRDEPTEWRPPDHHLWKVAEQVVPPGMPPIDPSSPDIAIRRLLEIWRFAPDFRWTRLSYGKEALLVLTDYSRTDEDLWNGTQLSVGDMDDARSTRHWFWIEAHAIRLRDPAVEPLDILRRYRGLLTAQSFITFTDAEGRPSIWSARWSWDPDLGIWHNNNSSGHGPYDTKLMFH